MTQMSVVDLVKLAYPGQIELNNIGFVINMGKDISISHWSVPGVTEPTITDLEAMMPEFQKQFDLLYFVNTGPQQLLLYLDSIAQQRQYDSAISCASYVSSTVPAWKEEADTFIAWRDSVFSYTIAQVELMQSGQRTVPTFEEFKTELPEMFWPS
jgi:hypothetical protein